ncbi:MAG: sigma-70 family RNA polymerase sigma factor [Planctomycetota bacterium]
MDDHHEPEREGPISTQLEEHRERLRRLIDLRLDDRVRGRVDASDVIQETQIEALSRAEEFEQRREVPLFVWLRFLALQKVSQLHRHHLGTQARDANREVSIFRRAMPSATSAALAAQLVGKLTTASQAAERAEMKARVEVALGEMTVTDQEVLTLLHFEQLTYREAAAVLEISEKALGGRYVRALSRLKRSLANPCNEPP